MGTFQNRFYPCLNFRFCEPFQWAFVFEISVLILVNNFIRHFFWYKMLTYELPMPNCNKAWAPDQARNTKKKKWHVQETRMTVVFELCVSSRQARCS